MKSLVLFLSLILSGSAFAKTVSIDVADELSYKSLRTYNDGMTFVEMPQMYSDYYFSNSNRGNGENNAHFVCQKLGMQFYSYNTTITVNTVSVVNFIPDENGQFSGPNFGFDSAILSKVICKR